MTSPVKNNGISIKANLGDVVKVNLNIGGGSTDVPEKQSSKVFGNVTENLGKNPNFAPANDAGDKTQTRANLNNGNDPKPKGENNGQRQTQGQNNGNNRPVNNRNNGNEPTARDVPRGKGNNNPVNKGQNGNLNASERGLENGRGHQKTDDRGQDNPKLPKIQPKNQTNDLPPNNRGNRTGNENQGENRTGKRGDDRGDNRVGNRNDDRGDNHGNNRTENRGNNRNNPTTFTNRNNNGNNGNNDHQNLGANLKVDLNLKANANQAKALVQTVVTQVLRQNDIYLNNNSVNRLLNNQTFENSPHNDNHSQTNLPRDVHNLVSDIGNRVLSLLDNSAHNDKLIHQISKEISQQLKENIQTAKQTILRNADLGATQFKNLNIGEKMHVAVELMPRHLPESAQQTILNYKANEVLNGLLLARGLVVPNEQSAEARNLNNFQTVLPREVSMTALRDVGQLVKILIADTAFAKSTANLDLAVQKFVRILLANNELGVLLATINLASQTQDRGGLTSRTLALVQIYELINQLLVAGEKAMKQAMPENAAAKNLLLKDLPGVKSSAINEADELKAQLNKPHSSGAESSLRQFLEFNPAFVHDNSASAFNDPSDARHAQKDFINIYHQDIESWLKSGNHRFVKDYSFEKPVGVVVERASEGFFTANTARFVLVRDGSVQGWHFLKSFLVK